ncbi:MAG: hypothetical protein KatS3mg129_1203 [Leptospiraceae bacterium]|nr:MAG: hypothetical protein KatS3mg129_1203 [Leptospiraceae bacterium]
MAQNNPKSFSIVINSQLSELNRIREAIEEKLNYIDIVELNRIILAIDEILSNIIEHGYKLKANNFIYIDFQLFDKKLIVKIEDNAPHFNILNYTDPDLEQHANKGKPRGLGLFLVRSIMDEIQYEPKIPEGNINILIKHLN